MQRLKDFEKSFLKNLISTGFATKARLKGKLK